MAKGNVNAAEFDLLASDWFLPAILSEGTVSDSLSSVLAQLEKRGAFVRGLHLCLSGQTSVSAAGIDSVTDLMQKIRSLENTLRFRLGILLPERPQAWFRSPAAATTGPFQSTLLGEPVFAPYDSADVEVVQQGLEAAWVEHRCSGLPFKDTSSCLWRTLLEYQARLEEISCLPAPYSALRLDELPDGLPPELASRALTAFLVNVRSEMLAARERLRACYEQLHLTSSKLWRLQREELKAPPRRGGGRKAADDLRAEFRRRRSSAQGRVFLTPADSQALEFMGFDDMPPAEVLRQRYLNMAKKLHPDLQGGSDHGFKILASAYAHLSARMNG